jgi:thymidylate synthase (FAD)
MKIIKPSFEILNIKNREDAEKLLKIIELAGRTCYKSEDKITQDSSKTFLTNILKLGHESVIEHVNISVKIICDRGVSHEIVRHRIASYSQESTRYCNYNKDKFDSEITVIEPCFWKKDSDLYKKWKESMNSVEQIYNYLISNGAKPQEARSILPNSLKTEIVMTANPRSWRNFFRLRTSQAAHPQIREIAIPMLEEFKILMPELFGDIIVNANFLNPIGK